MERFKDDWNVNKEFLMYCMDIIKRMGFYRATKDPYGWYIASSELYADVGALIDHKIAKKLNEQLKEIQQTLDGQHLSLKSRAAQRWMENKEYDALTQLDEFHQLIVSAMHQSRLILPKSDRRLGLKRLEEDFGIE